MNEIGTLAHGWYGHAVIVIPVQDVSRFCESGNQSYSLADILRFENFVQANARRHLLQLVLVLGVEGICSMVYHVSSLHFKEFA